jgi:DNA-binding response OmpR family regulator
VSVQEVPAAPGELILVVEDDEDTREMLVSLLSAKGYRVEWAASAVAAIERLQREPDVSSTPAVVLLDLMLPDMDGVEMVRRLSHVPQPRYIVLSAKSQTAVANAARSIGAVVGLRKPFDVARLLRSVRLALASKPGARVFEPSPQLMHRMRALLASPPILRGESIDGESEAWSNAQQVVELALAELGPDVIRGLGYQVELAYQSFHYATLLETAVQRVRLAEGAASLDFLITDALCCATLTLALELARKGLTARTDATLAE